MESGRSSCCSWAGTLLLLECLSRGVPQILAVLDACACSMLCMNLQVRLSALGKPPRYRRGKNLISIGVPRFWCAEPTARTSNKLVLKLQEYVEKSLILQHPCSVSAALSSYSKQQQEHLWRNLWACC